MPSIPTLLRRSLRRSLQPDQLPRQWLKHPEKHHRLLRGIVDRIRNSLELKVVLQAAVDEVATLLELDRCVFFWYFHDTQRAQVICESARYAKVGQLKNQPGVKRSFRLGYYPLETFGATAEAITRGELVVCSGEGSHSRLSRWLRRLLGLPPMRGSDAVPVMGALANLFVPVNIQETSIGFIACLSDQPRHWRGDDVALIRLLARQLEVAITQAQLYEQMHQQAKQEQLVNQITAQTRQSFDLEKILQGAIAQLLEALQVDRCLVHLVEESSDPVPVHPPNIADSGHLYEVCRSPFPATVAEFDANGPITRWVVENRRRVVITDITQDERIGADNLEYQQAQIKSSLVLPVQTKDALYAILYLNQCSYIRYWSKNDQKLAQAVADQLAISIQQAHLYAQTHQQAAESAAQAKHLAATLNELRLTQAQLIQSEKMSSLGRVVAGVAHEINNPISFIYGNIAHVDLYSRELMELLRAYQRRLPHPDRELQQLLDDIDLNFLLTDLPHILGSMRSGADRIRQIVLSLRNFSRVDESERKTVDLHEGIESTLSVLQPYLGEEIEVIRNYGTLPLIDCYPGELNQVFMNILMNAIDALQGVHQVHKTIAISTSQFLSQNPSHELVRIVITDNGPGIFHGVQSKIFDPFFTTKEVGQGTGLGLTISYQIVVNQHSGRLKFYSEPGFGAEFVIELPVCGTASA
jgi:two-component system NtrC family sensor kinase